MNSNGKNKKKTSSPFSVPAVVYRLTYSLSFGLHSWYFTLVYENLQIHIQCPLCFYRRVPPLLDIVVVLIFSGSSPARQLLPLLPSMSQFSSLLVVSGSFSSKLPLKIAILRSPFLVNGSSHSFSQSPQILIVVLIKVCVGLQSKFIPESYNAGILRINDAAPVTKNKTNRF